MLLGTRKKVSRHLWLAHIGLWKREKLLKLSSVNHKHVSKPRSHRGEKNKNQKLL